MTNYSNYKEVWGIKSKENDDNNKDNFTYSECFDYGSSNKPKYSEAKNITPISKPKDNNIKDNDIKNITPTSKPKESDTKNITPMNRKIEEFSLYKTSFYKSSMKFLCKYKYLFIPILIILFFVTSFYFSKKILGKDQVDGTANTAVLSAAAQSSSIEGKYLINMNNKYFIIPKNKVIEIN